jgi:5-oxoprolinase (ATP-hydrolysing)
MQESPDQNTMETPSKLSIKIAIGEKIIPDIVECPTYCFIDRGGTFTDCLGIVDGVEENILVKILSQDPSNYPDAPIEGIRRILEEATGKKFPRGQEIDTSQFQDLTIRMGTTVATNALLERKGERVALLITEGFKEALKIGLQSRPKLFDLNIKKPDVLYEKVIEVSERVTVESYQQSPSYDEDIVAIEEVVKTDPSLVRGLNGQVIRVLKRLDKDRVRADLQKLYDDGFRSICVCLAHSYTFQGE